MKRLILCAIITVNAAAQTNLTPGELPLAETDRLAIPAAPKAWQINVRKSFSSRIEEQKPATFTIITAGKGENAYGIDIGAALYYTPNERLKFAPALEWHRQSVSEHKNKGTAGVALDTRLTPAANPIAIILRGEGKLVRNILKDVTTGQAVVMFSGFKNGPIENASVIRAGGVIKGTWYPYAGYEALHRQPFGDFDEKNVSMAVARLEAKAYPFNRSASRIKTPFEIAATFTYRHPLGGDDLRSSYTFTTVEANVWVDAAHHLAFGFEYENGANPDNDFKSGHTGVLALKFKL